LAGKAKTSGHDTGGLAYGTTKKKQTDELRTRGLTVNRDDKRGDNNMNYKIPSDATPEERDLIQQAIYDATIEERKRQLVLSRVGGEAALKTATSLENAILKVRKERLGA
jgi:hypothetical protein